MKAVLVNPPDIFVAKEKALKRSRTTKGIFSKGQPPLGLAYVAAALERAQHEVQIIDCMGSEMTWQEICETLEKSNPDIVGITALTATLQSAFEIARKSKEFFSKVPVIIGGHGAYKIEEAILKRNKDVDIIVRGEGEETIVDLAESIKSKRSLKEISGICFRRGRDDVTINPARPFITDLDSLPFPSRHLLPMESYISEQLPSVLGKETFKATPLVSSRGCPFLCVFCASTNFYGHKWRPRSPENVVAEIGHLYQNYKKLGLSGYTFADDNFLADPDRVVKICDLLIDCGLSHLKWICEARVSSADEKVFSKMHEAGCRVVAFGIESGNDEVLKSIRKGITKDMVRRAVKMAKSTGLKIWGYFLIGLPKDTEETIKETIAFSKELDLDVNAFHPVFVYPGTDTGKEQSIDWLNFIVEQELDIDVGKETGFLGFHPCVPTYADRNAMKTMIRSVMTLEAERTKKRKRGILNRLVPKLVQPLKS